MNKKQCITIYILVYIILHISIKSYQNDCPNMSWTRMIPKDMPKCMGKSTWSFNLTQRIIEKKYNVRRKLGEGDVVLPREEHSNLLFSAKWSPLKNILLLIEISRCFHSIHVYTVLKTLLYLITLCFVASFKTIFILILSKCHECMQVMYFDHIKHLLSTNPPISTSHNTPNLISSIFKYIT